jgi:hypothetical protein
VHGSAVQSTGVTAAVDTTYYIWFHFESGTTGSLTIWFDTTNTNPGTGTKMANIPAGTGGMSSASVRKIQFRTASTDYVFDDIGLAQVAIP